MRYFLVWFACMSCCQRYILLASAPSLLQVIIIYHVYIDPGIGTLDRLSRGYLIVTNCLFACFGCALMVFGTLGAQQRLGSSILFPINVLKSEYQFLLMHLPILAAEHSGVVINILGIILVFSAVTGFVGAICIDRQAIHILYTTIILIVFIYQIATALIVYDQAVHTSTWLSQTWSDASQEYRYYAQSKVPFWIHLIFSFFCPCTRN